MFDEVVLNLNLGCKILAGHLVVGRFGQNQNKSIVAISQTLDKLVVHDPSLVTRAAISENLLVNNGHTSADGLATDDNANSIRPSPAVGQSIYYIAVKDVIRTISARSFKLPAAPEAPTTTSIPEVEALGEASSTIADNNNNIPSTTRHTKDLLLIGCSNSVLVYDASSQSNLLSINTPTIVNAISDEPHSVWADGDKEPIDQNHFAVSSCQTWPIICGGPRKIYALSFDGHPKGFDNFSHSSNFDAEISSERTIGDTITCLAQGTLDGLDMVLTGSQEEKIRIYLLDSFDQNIQPCKLTIDELAPVVSLCPIETSSDSASVKNSKQLNTNEVDQDFFSLPSIQATELPAAASVQMNYFAYGLENGIIGVYRLLRIKPPVATATASGGVGLSSERLWRYKCKQSPLTMLMYDINGDGLDELIVGFASSRLEVRSPFTGQLLATTRCFMKDRLAGLAVIDYDNDGSLMLIACSIAGVLVGYKPRVCRPRRPLKGYSLQQQQQPHSQSAMLKMLRDDLAADEEAANYSLGSDFMKATDVTSVANLKTIEEEQDRNVFKASSSLAAAATLRADLAAASSISSDLHIESHTDDTKRWKCDGRQSYEPLLRLNALKSEQMDLERKTIYHKSLGLETKDFLPLDIRVVHMWDFEASKAYLRLTLRISYIKVELKLIEFEDESGNLLGVEKPFLLRPLASPGGSSIDDCQAHKVVLPLRTKRDTESLLVVKVYCKSGLFSRNQEHKLTRCYCTIIPVPKFSMITLAPEQIEPLESSSSPQPLADQDCGRIKVAFRFKDSSRLPVILDWLNRSLLCLRFGQLLDDSNNLYREESVYDSVFAYPYDPNSELTAHYLLGKDLESFHLDLVDVRQTLQKISATGAKPIGNYSLINGPDSELCRVFEESEFTHHSSTLKIAYTKDNLLNFECENSELLVALIQSLVIDRLQLDPSDLVKHADNIEQVAGKDKAIEIENVNVEPISSELDKLTNSSRQLEESERRIQTELYESADYTKSLMQQFAFANELNEFTTAKELLNELFMMLNGAQNAARAQHLNNKSRQALSEQVNELKEKLAFLTSGFV